MTSSPILPAAVALALACGAANASGRADYTGLWKENCSDPYGLQIKPYQGNKYTISFCGPGGGSCTREPDIQRVTPIEGDPAYVVLGPTRIRIRYSDSYTPLYTKCTTDIHPVLEYSAVDEAEAARGRTIAVLIHLAYMLGAVAAYRLFHRRTRTLPVIRRRAYRSGLAAVLFSPGLLWTWPFVSPTFALMALVAHLSAIPQTGAMFLPAQLVYSLGPMLVVWVFLFSAAYLCSRVTGARQNNRADPDTAANGPAPPGGG